MIDRLFAAITDAVRWVEDHDGVFFGAVTALIIIMHLGGV